MSNLPPLVAAAAAAVAAAVAVCTQENSSLQIHEEAEEGTWLLLLLFPLMKRVLIFLPFPSPTCTFPYLNLGGGKWWHVFLGGWGVHSPPNP